MKLSRKFIAVISGVMMAFGYITISGRPGIWERIVVGVLFGVAIGPSMIRYPDRISRNQAGAADRSLIFDVR